MQSLSSLHVLMLSLQVVQGNKLEITSGSVITVIFAIIFNGVEQNPSTNPENLLI